MSGAANENSGVSRTFEKSIAISTTQGGKGLTLRMRKAINTIAYVAREAFFTRNPEFSSVPSSSITKKMVEETNTTYEIEQNFFMKVMGFSRSLGGYYSYTQVLSILKDLSDETIYFDSLGIAKRSPVGGDWSGFAKVIASAERSEGMFRIHVPPDIVHRLVNPDVSFQGLVDLSGLVSKNAPPIIDVCMYSRQNGKNKTEWFELVKIKNMLGAKADSWSKWKRLGPFFIIPAIDDINNKESLDFTVDFETGSFIPDGQRRRGKPPVTHLRFLMKDKEVKGVDLSSYKMELDLTTQKAELRSLGIADNQIESVLDECRDESGVLMIEFVQWVNRRGYELRRLSIYKDKSYNEFGAILRKQILRREWPNWLETNKILNQYLKNRKGIEPTNLSFKGSKQVVNDEIKRKVTYQFLTGLSEGGFVMVKAGFEEFVAEQVPGFSEELSDELRSNSLVSLEGRAFNLLTIFLRERHSIYSSSAYRLAVEGM